MMITGGSLHESETAIKVAGESGMFTSSSWYADDNVAGFKDSFVPLAVIRLALLSLTNTQADLRDTSPLWMT